MKGAIRPGLLLLLLALFVLSVAFTSAQPGDPPAGTFTADPEQGGDAPPNDAAVAEGSSAVKEDHVQDPAAEKKEPVVPTESPVIINDETKEEEAKEEAKEEEAKKEEAKKEEAKEEEAKEEEAKEEEKESTPQPTVVEDLDDEEDEKSPPPAPPAAEEDEDKLDDEEYAEEGEAIDEDDDVKDPSVDEGNAVDEFFDDFNTEDLAELDDLDDDKEESAAGEAGDTVLEPTEKTDEKTGEKTNLVNEGLVGNDIVVKPEPDIDVEVQEEDVVDDDEPDDEEVGVPEDEGAPIPTTTTTITSERDEVLVEPMEDKLAVEEAAIRDGIAPPPTTAVALSITDGEGRGDDEDIDPSSILVRMRGDEDDEELEEGVMDTAQDFGFDDLDLKQPIERDPLLEKKIKRTTAVLAGSEDKSPVLVGMQVEKKNQQDLVAAVGLPLPNNLFNLQEAVRKDHRVTDSPFGSAELVDETLIPKDMDVSEAIKDRIDHIIIAGGGENPDAPLFLARDEPDEASEQQKETDDDSNDAKQNEGILDAIIKEQQPNGSGNLQPLFTLVVVLATFVVFC